MAGILDGLRIIDAVAGIGRRAGLVAARRTGRRRDQGRASGRRPDARDRARLLSSGTAASAASRSTLSLAADRARLRQLLERADVMVESFTAAESARFELDYAELKAPFPHLVHCKISGYGMDHPWRDRPAIEALVAARTGLYHHQAGVRHDGPTFMYCPYASYGAAFTASARYLRRAARAPAQRPRPVRRHLTDGRGRVLHQHAVAMVGDADAGVQPFSRPHGALPGVAIRMRRRPVAASHAHRQGQSCSPWRRFLGIALPTDATWLTDAERWKFNDQVIAAFKTRPRDEWIKRLREVDIPVEAVMPAEAAFAREQTRVNGMVAVTDDPERGKVTQVGIPIRFSATSSAIKGLAPRPGQHTEEVMREVDGETPAAACRPASERCRPQPALSARRHHGAGLRRVLGRSIRSDGAGGPGRPRDQNRTAARRSDAHSRAVSSVHGVSARQAGPGRGPQASGGTQDLLPAGRARRRGPSQSASRRGRAAEDRL